MGMSSERATARTANDPPIPDIVVNKSVTMERKPVVERQQRIAETAYFIAQRRGFEPGHEIEDWLTAEILVSQESV